MVRFSYVMLLMLVLLFVPYVQSAPPQNFQTSLVIGSGLDGPTGFDFAPDGRIFILERDGTVKIYKNGQLLSQPFTQISVIATGDRGLLGIAFDPEFSTNKYVYFYYTGTDKLNRLVRYDASSDVATGTPTIIYETKSPSELLHVGGTVAFGKDGKIYLSVGDNGYPPNAQNNGNPHGKILRLNKDGSVPNDNPFVGTGSLPEIWANGLRNPFRFSVDPLTGTIYQGDVGHNDWEEINKIGKGQNYGWPVCEGYCNNPGYTNPQYAYSHYVNGNYMSSSVTGGPVYRATMFPAEYRGNLFFSDYARGFIKRMKLDSNGNNAGIVDFDNSAGSVVDMKIASDGSMYYVTYYPGRLYRVTYSSGNNIPVANAASNVTKGVEPLHVKFSSSGSYDPDGNPITYNWDFGDDTSSTSANPTKVYTKKGTYTVELTVSDGQSSSKSNPIVIQVGIPPTVAIGQPTNGSSYRAGDRIYYSVSAIDGAGNDIDDNDISTTVLFHHDTHTHPFVGPLKGRNNFFDIPTTGEPSSNVWYRLYVTATDDNGLSTTKTVDVIPQKVTLTFETSPRELDVVIDGTTFKTPHSFTSVVNFQREISAPAIQYLNGVTYSFSSWSNGGNRTQKINAPQDPTTYSANYVKVDNTNFIGEYWRNQNLEGSPTVVKEEPWVSFNWGTLYSPDSRIPGDHFSARWTKTQAFEEGMYRFVVTSDDGARLKIDGNLVLDKWFDQAVTTYTIDVYLTGGSHTIVMEYYENAGEAIAKLSWSQINRNYFDSNFYLSPNVNEHWEEVNVQPTDGRAIKKVYVRFNEGQWKEMTKASWGNWVANDFAAKGTRVEFIALDANNIISQSKIFYWIFGETSQTSTIPTSFPASFFLGGGINNYWVEVNAVSEYNVINVEVSVNNGVWVQLEKKSWGNWAKGMNVPSGSSVKFRATDSSSRMTYSNTFIWP